MAGPHPVVGVAAELSDRRRGCSHQTHVGVAAVHEHIVLVAIVQGLNRSPQTVAGSHCFLNELCRILRDQNLTLLLGHALLISVEHLLRHILHILEEAHGQSRIGQFFGAGHGPEAVAEVVVLHGAVFLDLAVAAVMVGQQKAFR